MLMCYCLTEKSESLWEPCCIGPQLRLSFVDPLLFLSWFYCNLGFYAAGLTEPLLSGFSSELNNYLSIDASLKTEKQRARLVSPVVGADTGPLCLVFSYQMWGDAEGHLKVLLRDAHHEETLLWTLKDDQGPVWKEGRTILPRSPKDFQVKTKTQNSICVYSL